MKEIKKKEEVERFLKQFSFHESEYKIDYAFKNKKKEVNDGTIC